MCVLNDQLGFDFSEGHVTVLVSSLTMAICQLSVQPMVGFEQSEGCVCVCVWGGGEMFEEAQVHLNVILIRRPLPALISRCSSARVCVCVCVR